MDQVGAREREDARWRRKGGRVVVFSLSCRVVWYEVLVSWSRSIDVITLWVAGCWREREKERSAVGAGVENPNRMEDLCGERIMERPFCRDAFFVLSVACE